MQINPRRRTIGVWIRRSLLLEVAGALFGPGAAEGALAENHAEVRDGIRE